MREARQHPHKLHKYKADRSVDVDDDFVVSDQDYDGETCKLQIAISQCSMYCVMIVMINQGFVKGEEFCFRSCDFYDS